MPNRTLRAIHAGLASAQTLLSPPPRRTRATRAAQTDSACFVAPLEGLVPMDIAFGCRTGSLLEHLRPKAHPPILQPLPRLYAAIGAAMTANGKPPLPVVVAFFERHEIDPRRWTEALTRAAALPLLLVILPRWKGASDSTDLGEMARASGIPSIPVDAQDAIALYRVSQESFVRAREGGGAAIIEAVSLDSQPAIEKLASYLAHRGIPLSRRVKLK